MQILLEILLLTAFISIVINAFLKRFDLPPIIGYILSGAVITHIFSLHKSSMHTLHDIAEFGIAFLMFTIGLEFSVKNFKKLRKEIFLFGTLQVISTLAFFALITNVLFNLPIKSSIIIGSALALSSTAIVLKIMSENQEIRKNYGRIVLGILIFQDIAVIPIVLMVSFFTASESVSLFSMITSTIVSASALLILLVNFGKYLVTPFLSYVFDSKSHELFIGSILLIVIAASYAAHSFGFSYSLGAFIGGMILAETSYKHQIEADLTPFRDLLLGVFFVTVGMQISLEFFVSNFFQIIAVIVAIMAIKALLIFSSLYFFSTTSNALKSAITLSQVGEFSFVVLELARINALTTREINQTLIIAVVISMVLTPFIIKNLQLIVEKFIKKEKLEQPFNVNEVKEHVVVIGYGNLGREVCKNLKKKGIAYVAIDNHRQYAKDSKNSGDPFILGNTDQSRIYETLNLKNALAIIITLERDSETFKSLDAIYHISRGAQIVASSRDDNSDLMMDKRLHFSIYEHKEIAESMVTKALSCEIR